MSANGSYFKLKRHHGGPTPFNPYICLCVSFQWTFHDCLHSGIRFFSGKHSSLIYVSFLTSVSLDSLLLTLDDTSAMVENLCGTRTVFFTCRCSQWTKCKIPSDIKNWLDRLKWGLTRPETCRLCFCCYSQLRTADHESINEIIQIAFRMDGLIQFNLKFCCGIM